MADENKMSFLARWVQRKSSASAARPELTDETPEKTASPLDLPAIETLTAASNYRQFLADNVPLNLQREALQRLWTSNPELVAPDNFEMHSGGFGFQPLSLLNVAVDLSRHALAVDSVARQEANANSDIQSVFSDPSDEKQRQNAAAPDPQAAPVNAKRGSRRSGSDS